MQHSKTVNEVPKSDLRLLIEALQQDASEYFRNAARAVKEHMGDGNFSSYNVPADFFRQKLPDELIEVARTLIGRLVR